VDGPAWEALLFAALLTLLAGLGIVWQARARTAQRLNDVMDAYAIREISQMLRKNAPLLSKRSSSTPGKG
jgi:hypothetical protein